MSDPFTCRRSGTCGHEILDPDGSVIAWTVDAGWAGTITGLLNGAVPFQRLIANNLEKSTMTKQEIKNLVQTLLKHRPDLVIVKTDSEQEKMTLVKLLKSGGAKVICKETK
jgi:hypothetical protein